MLPAKLRLTRQREPLVPRETGRGQAPTNRVSRHRDPITSSCVNRSLGSDNPRCLRRKFIQAAGNKLGDAMMLLGGKFDTDDAIARPHNLALKVSERRHLQSHEFHRDYGLGDTHPGAASRQVGYGAREALRPDLYLSPPAHLMSVVLAAILPVTWGRLMFWP